MESTDKLTDTNAVLAYLYETFPLCFIAEGETKPLKIGLFQDLAARLADDSKVSKTQLRVALRRYTSSWRYLKGVKAGVQRIDLDGQDCGELEQEHIDHAQQTLKEGQEKAKAKRQAVAAKAAPKKPARKPAAKAPVKKDRPAKPAKPAAPKINYVAAKFDELKQKQRVSVKLGQNPVPGVITDIKKEDIHVQLDTGLIVKVRAEHILLS
ncbi:MULTISPECIES: RNA chaperone ProQ [unclassified Shewanella]|uniref:RNA chaperone ProQ n=1 Tax=unclassified Shewanella TaxID=196818 RepID=UPI000C853517|nr:MULTISPECIES: RNA chaperone ProQ [unclassified Shewanella]MDO6618094.1 RNA chaperone ProQ [Shewanella sp. 6_MG-2023]MDO6638366.1 RNA chaperone ProQ [Shewanella sp. 5_MG-2023]MDO6677458.1 RNA chaperone ProQ [Shewanella sp. 4_MG-2023]PMG26472.1 RNA chaperone ProQ [Shewanella sp. 10N.286.52.C2]PMG41452.1 RNA chaperone ProQ [Shewanella sp. 10N.286.52.B9]